PLNGSMARPNTALQIARMAALIRAEDVKIVHATDFNTNLLGLAAARLGGAKAVVSRVDLGHIRTGFTRWHREAEKLNSRFADIVVANADAVKAVCIRDEGCGPDKVMVVRNGLDLEQFDALAAQPLQAPLPEGRLVAVIGNLWPVKGHRTLVEAVARLPIVATQVGGNPELVSDNGLLVPSGDARALASGLAQLLSRPEEGRAMGARGRKRIEQELSLDRMADGHGALYRRVLGRAPYVGDQAALRPA